MATDIPADWSKPVGKPVPLPFERDPSKWFRVNTSGQLTDYEIWLADHGHTLEDQ